ncbi:hypothetical protein CCMA1212_009555 [Trichoderma ghanense]|uniref:Uncharacterized protein n=1 Tax=Trichoderma ghanense TaxID=65468 RepID=A0ABY2GS18_9HYPO
MLDGDWIRRRRRDDVSSRSGKRTPTNAAQWRGPKQRLLDAKVCEAWRAVSPMAESGSAAANRRHVARSSQVGPAARSKARRRMSNPCRCCSATTSKLVESDLHRCHGPPGIDMIETGRGL